MIKKIKVAFGFSLALVCLANVAVKQVILTIIINLLCRSLLQLTKTEWNTVWLCVEVHLNLETVPTHTVRVSRQLQVV